ncbi:DUF3558 domain-containing protein [Amycolatopsis magusensis]|uniref:DUF3558 domain-containing protein n=1 Tax=Amycolatopsis magusensis TaxID=882444 RepID=UPI0024A7F39C|nr:DUF3558 domain-containing protein [Amycolatopsis magusensis]MDI5981969.1 DUF3558 domain-containing protein [Amycolatopsis magusensis]
MGTQRFLGLTAAALAAGALLAGCGGGKEGSAGNIPTATVPGGQPPAEASDPPASEGTGSGAGSAPRVSSPVDTEKVTGDVCATLSSAKVSELGLTDPTPRDSSTGPTCNWNFTEGATNRLDISAQAKNPNGLSDIYDQKDEFAYFEELEVGGYPAVYADITDARSSGDCSLYVGLNDQFAVRVSSTLSSGPDESRPCPVVEKAAEAMIDTVKGG